MSDPRFERLCDNLTTVVMLLDSDLRLFHLNPAGEQLLETSVTAAAGATLTSLLRSDADLDALLRAALTSTHSVIERGLQLTLHNGSQSIVDITATPMQEPHYPRCLLVEIVQVDRHLQIAREEHLLGQQQATRRLVRGLAHEIKNPLGGLRGAAQLLEREIDDPQLREYTRVIIGEADRLRGLVDRMLAPDRPPQRGPLNLHEILEHVHQVVRTDAPDSVLFRRDYDPSIPTFEGDRDQLVQASLNLVRNAVEAIAESGGTIQLRTRVLRHYTLGYHRHRLVASISVIDDGPGVDPGVREGMFMPMVTTKASGTGLGLSIAQSLVQQHDGLIHCDSRPGRTEFTILLPLEKEHD